MPPPHIFGSRRARLGSWPHPGQPFKKTGCAPTARLNNSAPAVVVGGGGMGGQTTRTHTLNPPTRSTPSQVMGPNFPPRP